MGCLVDGLGRLLRLLAVFDIGGCGTLLVTMLFRVWLVVAVCFSCILLCCDVAVALASCLWVLAVCAA